MSLLSLINPLETIIDKFVPDANEKIKAKQAVKDFFSNMNSQQVKLLQLDIMKGGLFQRGWRPFIGWVCGFALFYHFILYPISIWFAVVVFGVQESELPPDLDITALYPLMIGMLGLGGLRSFEKTKGKDTK